MTATTLHLTLPVVLAPTQAVKLWLTRSPSPRLAAKLGELRYMQAGYPDERMGRVADLDAAREAAEQDGNTVWKIELVGDHSMATIIGDLLAHARVYVPDAAGARLPARIACRRASPIATLMGQYIVWAQAPVAIER